MHVTKKLLKDILDVFSPALIPGGAWAHVKTGGVYVIRNVCLDSDTLEPMVVYENDDGITFVRPAFEFLDGRFVEASTPPAEEHKVPEMDPEIVDIVAKALDFHDERPSFILLHTSYAPLPTHPNRVDTLFGIEVRYGDAVPVGYAGFGFA